MDPCKIFIHDWMHGIFVGGVWNVALYLVLEMLIDAGYIDIYNVFADFIAKWSWPGRISNSAHLHHWQVRTGSSAIQAGALVLAPVVPLMQITTKSSEMGLKIGSFEVDEETVDFFVVPSHKKAFGEDTMDKLVQDGKQPLLAAFWWVAEKPNKKEANMEIAVKEAKGKSIPCLQNTVELPPFTQLVRHVPGKVWPPGKQQVRPLCETAQAAPKKAARLGSKTS